MAKKQINIDNFSQKRPNTGRRTAIVDALNKAIGIFTSHDENTFDKVMASGIRPIAEAVGLDRIVFFRRLDINGNSRFRQTYRWDGAEGGMVFVDEELKVLPDTPVLTRWISFMSEGACVSIRESDMAEDELAFLRTFGVKSILIVPIFTHGLFWGGVALQNHTSDRYFDEDCADLLHSSARLFANSAIRAEVSRSAGEAIQALKRREKMADMLNKAAIIFLSQTRDVFEETMTEGVGLMVDVVNVDRLSIFRNFTINDDLHTSQIYRWDRESGGTTSPTKMLADVTYAKLAPRWE